MITEPAVITAIVSVISLLIIAAGGAYWLGRLSNRVDRLEEKVDQLDGKVDQLRSELLEEMRRSNQQLLLTLVNHRHDTDGYPVFRMPVAAE